MLHSNERMDIITEYMTSYEEKIKMANKNGLFDAAKMFELFAVEVCNVWFGQKFSNLNVETATYPYVDLISENRELLVQVSTVQDIPTKIKSTLELNKPNQRLNAVIKKCNDNMVSGQIDLPSTLDAIKVILELMKDTDMAFPYENLLILLIASAITY